MAIPDTAMQPELQVSQYLYDNCKLWVWDFDDTLIDTSTYYIKNMDPFYIKQRTNEELDDEIPHWKYFRQLVTFLVSSGKKVGIASFGTYEIIQAYMDRIFGYNQRFFTRRNIMASCRDERSRRDFKMPKNKNSYIYYLMDEYKIQDFQTVVLFDDLSSNISDASAVGVLSIKINGRDQNGIMNKRELFGPKLMKAIDEKSDILNQCDGKNILFLREKYGAIGNRKAAQHDKQFGINNKFIYSDRIYVDEKQKLLRQEQEQKRRKAEETEMARKYKYGLGTSDILSYSKEEGFQNQHNTKNKNIKINKNKDDNTDDNKQCNYCSRVMSDVYFWILLLILILIIYATVKFI